MGFVDVKWGGFAKIIVDTATMQVGDKVRVKSMTTGTTYDKTVATVGTPLVWETEIYKDYVKICMVQTINDTPTEIGGVYREVDYGQTLFVNVLDKKTLGGIQGILNAHQESSLLAIGDEVEITESGVLATYIVTAIDLYDSHEVIFSRKYLTDTMSGTPYDANYGLRTGVQNILDSLYNNIAEKSYIKDKQVNYCYYSSGQYSSITKKIWLPTSYEMSFTTVTEQNIGNKQFPLFATQANRIKSKLGGSAETYMIASHTSSTTANSTDVVNSAGAKSYSSSSYPLLPCFRLTADS